MQFFTTHISPVENMFLIKFELGTVGAKVKKWDLFGIPYMGSHLQNTNGFFYSSLNLCFVVIANIHTVIFQFVSHSPF